MKKGLKVWSIVLILLVLLVLISTKVKVIPNWLEIWTSFVRTFNPREKLLLSYDSYVCPKWYKYWVYLNAIKWYRYVDIKSPPNRNSPEYEKEFKDWQRYLKKEKIMKFTFGPFEWCIPENWNLELCTDDNAYDYVFCSINMIPLNNECPKWYSFIKAWIVWPYDLCQGGLNIEEVIDSKWYIHIAQIPLQDECLFFKWMWVYPADGHCD